MKTVMKKLLSVALAAILLVSAVPFQASATSTGNSVNANVTIDITGDKTGSVSKTITVTDSQTITLDDTYLTGLIPATDNDYEYSLVSWSDNASQNQTTGGTLQHGYLVNRPDYLLTLNVNAKKHTYTTTSVAATCTANAKTKYTCTSCTWGYSYSEDVANTALGHSYGDWTFNTSSGLYERVCTRDASHVDTAKKVTLTLRNTIAGASDVIITGAAGSSVSLPSLPSVSGYASGAVWKIEGTGYTSGTPLTLTNDMDGKTYDAEYTANSTKDENTVTVTLKLRAGNSSAGYKVIKSIALTQYDFKLQSTDTVLGFLTDRIANYQNYIATNYPDYTWKNNVFYDNNGTTITATNNGTVANGKRSIVIYADIEQADVIVYVYNKSTTTQYTQLTLNNQAPGASVSAATVQSLLSSNSIKYTSGSFKMFDEEGWTGFKAGKSGTNSNDVTVRTDGKLTKIYVYLTGATSTADSTNPKTGDMIFIPAMVMLASAAAVAYIYMGTKKRATR